MVWVSRLNSCCSPIQIKIVITIDDSFKEFDIPDQFSDMCLEVGTGKFHVAKWLLINQSARFKKMLEQGDLNEIKECENLSREKLKRSIKDINRLGNVFEMPEVKFRPKPSAKTETKKRQFRDTKDDNKEDDVDGMPLNRRKLPQKNRCFFWTTHQVLELFATSLQHQLRQRTSLKALRARLQHLHLNHLHIYHRDRFKNSVVPAAGIPIAEQAPPARPVKSEEPHEIIFDNGRAPQPSVPRTLFFLTLFRGLVAMISEQRVNDLKNIDDVIQPPKNKNCREQSASNYKEQQPGSSGANDAAPVSRLEDAKFPVGTYTNAIIQFNNTMNLGFVVTLLNDIKHALVLIDRDAGVIDHRPLISGLLNRIDKGLAEVFLHSAITERVQQRVSQLFYEDWCSKLLLRFRQIRDELVGKIFNFWQMLQFQQEPAQRHISRAGPITRSRRSKNDPYRNPSSFGLYQDEIEVYNNNEMKLVYSVCGINLVLFAFLIRFLFI